MNVVAEQIKILVELQGFDTQIYKLKKIISTKPDEIAELKKGFEDKQKNLNELEERLKNLQLDRKKKEMDLESREANIVKLNEQLFMVKKNEEYAAIQKEINTLKADNSVLEEEIIGILDKIDIEKENIEKEKTSLSGEEKILNEKIKTIEEEIARANKELEGLTAQRNEIALRVDRHILTKYERILLNRDGLAIVSVENEACSGCNLNIPPQVVNEIKMSEKVIVCENCSRILYTND